MTEEDETERSQHLEVLFSDEPLQTITAASEVEDRNDNEASSESLTNNVSDDNAEIKRAEYSNVDNNLIDLPQLSSDNYLTDDEFKDMYQYLKSSALTGDDERDRITLLLLDQYFIENNALYRRTVPRNKSERRLQNYTERLCIPLSHRRDVLKSFHDRLGHSGTKCLFLTLSQQIYWKNLYADVCDYVATCDICLRAKRNFGFRATPVHPLTVPSEPGEVWSLDPKVLSRKTYSVNVAILCCIDQFTSWPTLRAVQDLTAETTAQVFFQDIIATWRIPKLLLTDNGPSFMGGLTTELPAHLHCQDPYPV